MTPTERFDIAMDYLRAAWWRIRGARIATKVRIAKGCEVTRLAGLGIESRAVLEPGVVIKLVSSQSRLEVGKNVFIGRDTQFDIDGELTIGDGTLIAPGCFITDHNHGIKASATIWQQPCVQKNVRIGAGAWLGAKVIVLSGVTIGDGAVVAAGAVVTHDVEPLTIVAGVPARLVGSRA